MDSSTRLLESLVVREFYLHLAQSLGIPSSLPISSERTTNRESHERALARVFDQTGVDLGTSRVRVGVSRGHLFEIVVSIPLDVAGSPDALQLASEIFFESRLSEQLLDDWVACISVDRIARTRGLMVASDVATRAEHHPLEVGAELLNLGIKNLTAGLPESLFAASSATKDWVALEIPPSDSGLQPERCFASTRFPEALKCALEGMPFSSCRFTRGPEAFCWLSWTSTESRQKRLETRDRVEMNLAGHSGSILFAGSGFGEKRDYVDVWVLPGNPELGEVLSDLARSVQDLELGFYESTLQRHVLRISG
jgi:hypothetical protein